MLAVPRWCRFCRSDAAWESSLVLVDTPRTGLFPASKVRAAVPVRPSGLDLESRQHRPWCFSGRPLDLVLYLSPSPVAPYRGALRVHDPEAADFAVQSAGVDAELLRGADTPMGRDEPKD